MTSAACGYIHMGSDAEPGVTHLSTLDGVLCSSSPLADLVDIGGECRSHCLACEAVAVGNAVVIGGKLTYV